MGFITTRLLTTSIGIAMVRIHNKSDTSCLTFPCNYTLNISDNLLGYVDIQWYLLTFLNNTCHAIDSPFIRHTHMVKNKKSLPSYTPDRKQHDNEW